MMTMERGLTDKGAREDDALRGTHDKSQFGFAMHISICPCSAHAVYLPASTI